MPHRCIVLTATLIASLVTFSMARADSDVEVIAQQPVDVRIVPGHSGTITAIVKNLGPDGAAPTLNAEIGRLDSGYTLAMSEPACGTFSASIGANSYYSVDLGPIPAGASKTCRFVVARDTSAHAADDFVFYVTASTPGDAHPDNDSAYFVLGSFIDVAIDITPVSFHIDRYGFAYGTERLHVMNFGPSRPYPFVVGACEDNGFPGFSINGEFDGGCGSAEFWPACFDEGFGFEMPSLAPGEETSCDIELASIAPYEAPLGFDLRADAIYNYDTRGGWLIDLKPNDNVTTLWLEPLPGHIFVDGFDL